MLYSVSHLDLDSIGTDHVTSLGLTWPSLNVTHVLTAHILHHVECDPAVSALQFDATVHPAEVCIHA